MQIEKGEGVETDLPCLSDEQLNRGLVIQNHLRFELVLAFCSQTFLDQVLGIEPRVGVALQPAGRPREIDQQPVHDVARVGAGGTFRRG